MISDAPLPNGVFGPVPGRSSNGLLFHVGSRPLSIKRSGFRIDVSRSV